MKEKREVWGQIFFDLIGDLALFLYRLQSRLPAIKLVPEEYPNDLNQQLPSNSAQLLVVTEYEEEAIDSKKIRNKPTILYNLIVAGVLRVYSKVDELQAWQDDYKENETKIKEAVAEAIKGRKFYLKMSKRELRKMREDISEHGIGLFFQDNPLGIGLQVCVKGESIRGIQNLGGGNDIRLPWTSLFPKGTPERVYFDKIAFWNNFWSNQLVPMIDQGVVVDPAATWQSCQRQIRHCRKVIKDTGVLGKKHDDE